MAETMTLMRKQMKYENIVFSQIGWIVYRNGKKILRSFAESKKKAGERFLKINEATPLIKEKIDIRPVFVMRVTPPMQRIRR